jgi:hypothetical protein
LRIWMENVESRADLRADAAWRRASRG